LYKVYLYQLVKLASLSASQSGRVGAEQFNNPRRHAPRGGDYAIKDLVGYLTPT